MGDNAPCEHPRSPIEGIRYSRRSARVNPKHHPAFILITATRPRTYARGCRQDHTYIRRSGAAYNALFAVS